VGRRRVPILAKLLLAYLLPTVATFAGFGVLAHWVARRALEEELGRRLVTVAAAAAAQIADENIALLQRGDEQTRTYRNVQRRLEELRRKSGVARIYVFAADGTSRVDTQPDVAIGAKYNRLLGDAAELRSVFGGRPTSSVLFRGFDGALYKSGYAPLSDDASTPPQWAIGVDGAAPLYEQLADLRRTLLVLGVGGTALVIFLSIIVARLITRPVRRLERAAARIGEGDLEAPVDVPSRDEIGLVAETLEDMRRQLRSRDERLQMMLAGIAHEVRNPLGGMELYAGLLRDELSSAADEEKRALLQRIERELGHLKHIVTEFLEYARRPRPELRPVDAGQLLDELKELLAAEAAAHKVTISVEQPPEPTAIRADAGQLRRALLNLGVNAIHASPEGGAVRLAVRAADGGPVAISVSDEGPGIPPEILPQIWTPFYTTKQKGTGLGLAFARDIARDHGAALDVDTGAGRGTTFTLTVPPAAR
jgi:signal transduction histidine kinase